MKKSELIKFLERFQGDPEISFDKDKIIIDNETVTPVESKPEMAFARVICPKHSHVDIDETEYDRQLRLADRTWECPKCQETAQFDDAYYENKNSNPNEPKACEKCGKIDASVSFRVDPYLDEIQNNSMEFWLCSKCVDESLDSI